MGDEQAGGTYRRRDGVLARRIAGETMLVPIRGELAKLHCIFALNPVGEFIWERLDGRGTLGDIREAIEAEFEVGAAEAARDLNAFLAELRDQDLIETVPPRPGIVDEVSS